MTFSSETYNMSVDEVEALMRLYQELPDEMIKRMFDEDGDLIEAGNFLHRLYHWNREHFSLYPLLRQPSYQSP